MVEADSPASLAAGPWEVALVEACQETARDLVGPNSSLGLPIEKTLVGEKTGKPMPKLKWRFTGSALSKPIDR